MVAIAVAAGVLYWVASRGHVSTEDAQIAGDLVPITARVAGYVDSVEVVDGQDVSAGQLLVRLDRRDLASRVGQAAADENSVRAQAAAAAEQVSVVQRTAPAGEQGAGAGVAAARSAVAAAETQTAAAEAQAGSAEAGVESARSVVAGAQSELRSAAAQVQSAEAGLAAAQADVTSAEAQAKRASADAERFRHLYASGAVSGQQLDAAEAAATSAEAALKAARDRADIGEAAVRQARARQAGSEAGLKQASAGLAAARAGAAQAGAGVRTAQTAVAQAQARLNQAISGHAATETTPQQIAISKQQSRAAGARVGQAAAALRAAQLQLSYTTITAPVSGRVAQKSVEPGQFVQPGQLLMAVVPLHNAWVVANFKETDVGRIQREQPAVVQVDAYPGRRFRGRVESISPASQAQFSLLPPQNATGNFIKVVQRIPVKIVFTDRIPKDVVLRPGQNVVATVYLTRK